MKKLFFFSAFLFICSEATAKPEYALRIRTNRCTTCHSSPGGGGHRNLTGKTFGPKPSMTKFSEQDMFGLDWRAIAYAPIVEKEVLEKSKNGVAIMTALPSVSIPFMIDENKGQEWRFVHSHNIGGFAGQSVRDSYLRIKLYDDYKKYPQFISFGRFSAPFGLLTDEHRTYVRQQTKTSWNDREMGLLLSGDWSYTLHYDLALVNGEQTQGASFGNGNILKWGGIANIRYMSMSLGWMAGASFSYHNNEKNSSALSLYQALSLDSLTNNKFPGVILAEAVAGYKTNDRLALFFSRHNPQIIESQSYSEQVSDSTSLGYLFRWNYNFRSDWSFIFKYDHLIPDMEFYGDYFQRFGLGLSHFFNNQTSLEARYEKAIVTPKSEEALGKTGLAAQDALWLLLQVKI